MAQATIVEQYTAISPQSFISLAKQNGLNFEDAVEKTPFNPSSFKRWCYPKQKPKDTPKLENKVELWAIANKLGWL